MARIHKKEEEPAVLQRIREFIDRYEGEFAALMLAIFSAFRGKVGKDEVKELIISQLLTGEAKSETLDAAWQEVVQGAVPKVTAITAETAAGALENVPNLTPVNEIMYQWSKSHAAEWVSDLADGQRANVRQMIAQAVRSNMDARTAAGRIQDIIGLNSRQLTANMKYYNTVKDTLTVDYPEMSPDEISRRASAAARKMALKQRRDRAVSIARTELAAANSQAQDTYVREAQRLGLMGQVKKKWVTAGNDNVCPICNALNNTIIEMDSDFPSAYSVSDRHSGKTVRRIPAFYGEQRRLPPAHPCCVCGVTYVTYDKGDIFGGGLTFDDQNGIMIPDRLRLPEVSSSTITRRIRAGELSTKLSQQQYLKHVKGSTQFQQYKEARAKKGGNPQSILLVSEQEAQAIIESKAGTGIVRVGTNGEPRNVENITCDKVIGKYYGGGKYHETNKAAIHYGKRLSHIVPIKGDNYD